MTNLEKIRAACIKANPEIVELKFGCEIQGKSNKVVYTVLRDSWEKIGGIFVVRNGEYDGGGVTHWSEKDLEYFKILGRPIRLADVLLTMKEKIYISRIGEKAYFGSTMEDISQGAYWKAWNLRSDDLSLQSEETINFLAGLLTPTSQH